MDDDDLDRELRAHLDLEAEELRAAGSSPQDASHAARRTLGNITLLKETIRDMASWTSFERLLQDLRYGVRLLRRTPGFSAVAILTLALGMGATTVLFSVVNGVLLNPLAYAHSDRLAVIYARIAGLDSAPIEYPNFLDWQRDSRSFASMAAYRNEDYNFIGNGEGERVSADRLQEPRWPATMLDVGPSIGAGGREEEGVDGVEELTEVVGDLGRPFAVLELGARSETCLLRLDRRRKQDVFGTAHRYSSFLPS